MPNSLLPSHPSPHPPRPLETPPQPPPRLPIQSMPPHMGMSLGPRAASLPPPMMLLIHNLAKLSCCRAVLKAMVQWCSRQAQESRCMLRALRLKMHLRPRH